MCSPELGPTGLEAGIAGRVAAARDCSKVVLPLLRLVTPGAPLIVLEDTIVVRLVVVDAPLVAVVGDVVVGLAFTVLPSSTA